MRACSRAQIGAAETILPLATHNPHTRTDAARSILRACGTPEHAMFAIDPQKISPLTRTYEKQLQKQQRKFLRYPVAVNAYEERSSLLPEPSVHIKGGEETQ